MKRIIASLVVLSLAKPAFAQDVDTIPPGDDKIVPVQQGQPAPFSGQLFEPNTALRWANWLKQYKLILKINNEYNTKVCKANTDFLNTSLEQEREKYKIVTDEYQKREADMRYENDQLRARVLNPPWYTSVWFGVGVGAVMVGVAIGVGAYVSN